MIPGWRPGRRRVDAGMVGQFPQTRSVPVDHVEVGVALALARRGEAQPGSIGRPRGQPVFVIALGDLFHRPFIDVRDEDVRRTSPVRHVGDRPSVGRPARKHVQRPAGRDATLVLAIVVGDVDLFDIPLLDRSAHAFAVAIRHEGELAERHAVQRPLRLVDLVGRGVGELPRVGAGARVDFAEYRLARPHVEQADLDLDAAGRFLDGSDDESVGVQLAPAVERNVAERRGFRDRGVDVAGNEQEFAFVVQVVPQHLADDARDRRGLGVRRRRHEIRYRQTGRLAGLTGDRSRDFGRLLRGRWRLWRLLLQREDRQRRREERCRHWYWKLRWTVHVGFGNGAGRGFSVRVPTTARSAARSSTADPLDFSTAGSTIWPLRWMVNFTSTSPVAPP